MQTNTLSALLAETALPAEQAIGHVEFGAASPLVHWRVLPGSVHARGQDARSQFRQCNVVPAPIPDVSL